MGWICLSLCFTWVSSEACRPILEVGVGEGHTGIACWGRGGGRWLTVSVSRAGGPRCALRGRHCGWECPFHAHLGPQQSASREQSGGVQTTGKGTGTRWIREPCIPPSLLTQSWSPLTQRSRKGLAFGVKALTALPVCDLHRFSQAA